MQLYALSMSMPDSAEGFCKQRERSEDRQEDRRSRERSSASEAGEGRSELMACVCFHLSMQDCLQQILASSATGARMARETCAAASPAPSARRARAGESS